MQDCKPVSATYSSILNTRSIMMFCSSSSSKISSCSIYSQLLHGMPYSCHGNGLPMVRVFPGDARMIVSKVVHLQRTHDMWNVDPRPKINITDGVIH